MELNETFMKGVQYPRSNEKFSKLHVERQLPQIPRWISNVHAMALRSPNRHKDSKWLITRGKCEIFNYPIYRKRRNKTTTPLY